MDSLFPSRELIKEDWRPIFRDINPDDCTVTDIDPDDGSVLATAEKVTHIKRVHMRSTMGIGDGSIPDERCRFYLIADEIPFTVERYGRILDADGLTWLVDSSRAIGKGAIIECETTRVRS